jgi:oligopeptide transport system substrate-binding protein
MDVQWHYSKLLWLMLTATSLLMNACASPAAVPVPKAPTPARVATPVPAAGPAQSTTTAQHVEAPTPTAAQAPRSTGPSVLRLNLGEGDVTTIDPVRAYDVGSGLIVDETFIGLTRLNPVTGALEPGLATTWDISPDGLVYTFHLRPDVPWVHYRTGKVAKVQTCPDAQGQTQDRLVTAQDFAYGILRALNPATAADWGHILADAIAGGEPFNTGKITDTAKVGVKVLNPQTLQIRFNQPEAYNADIAGVSGAAAQPRWLIEGDACTEAQNDRWTEPGALQSYGPYALKDWTHEASLTLVKNPFWRAGIANIPQPRIDELAFRMLGNEAAFTEYEAVTCQVERSRDGLGSLARSRHAHPAHVREARMPHF